MSGRAWSDRSLQVRATLDRRLQQLCDRTLYGVADISLISGYRGREEQNRKFREGKSTLEWPQSKHNTYPSVAVDFQPYPYPEDERKLWGALGYIAGRMHGIAQELGFKIRWGGDWDRDGDMTDQRFDDLFHIEIIEDEWNG